MNIICIIYDTEDKLLRHKCGMFYAYILRNILLNCEFLNDERDQFWCRWINICPITLSAFLHSLADHEPINVLRMMKKKKCLYNF